jgi:hypothetical protein
MDNINITVNETIENIVVNPSITTEVIDVNITGTTETVNIDVTPNLTTVNINSISGSPVTKTSDLINDGEDGINPFITLEDIPAVTGFVPYIGATEDVNLGEFGVQLGNIEFDLTPTNTPTAVGSMFWNDTAGTLDLKLKGGAVTLQIGQETVARVVNKTATNITLLESNYQIVRVTGAQGQRPKVDLALANNDLNSTTTLGLVTENILNNQEGFITTSGQVQQINTTGSLQGETWADGDVLYLSGTVAGRCTNIKPIAPVHTVIIGFVEYAHITQGKIFVKVDNGYELEELHNVSAIAPNNNEVLTYDTPTLLWKPKTIATILGYTPFQLPSLTSGSVLFSDGTTIAQKNSNFFWDNTNNRLGIGTNAPTDNLTVIGGITTKAGASNTQITMYDENSSTYTQIIKRRSNNSGNFGLPVGSSEITTNTAFGINSNAYLAFAISNSEKGRFAPTTGNLLINTTIDNGGKLQIKAPGALSTDIALRVRNSADTGNLVTIDGTGVLKVGNTNYSYLTNNAVAFFATDGNIVVDSGRSLLFSQGATVNSRFSFNGNFSFGANVNPTSRVYIRGTGTTSSTTAFIIDNSAVSQLLKITDDGSLLLGIGSAVASAKVQIDSTTQGFLPPRMTNAQRLAIATPAIGLIVYCTDTIEGLYINKSTGWTFII